MKFDPNDSKWTAYVLNELNDRERADVELEIARNPEAKKLVGEIRSVTGELASVFTRESHIELDAHQRQSVLAKAQKPSGRLFQFPRWAPIAISAAAALAVAVIGFQQHYSSSKSNVAELSAASSLRRDAMPIAAKPSTPPGKDESVVTAEDAASAPQREEAAKKYFSAVESKENTSGKFGNGKNKTELYTTGSLDQKDTYVDRERSRLAQEAQDAASVPASAPAFNQVLSRTAAGYVRTFGGQIGGIVQHPSEIMAPTHYGPSLDDFSEIHENTFQRVSDHPLSTFSIDVDTASYSVMRKILQEGSLPPKDAVRIEELVNYFTYDYAVPRDGKPFASNMEVAPCPWKPEHYLVRVALKGREIESKNRPPCNLVYLLDVSGSMNDANKLPLVKRAMQALVNQLDERDHVAIVVYAGAAGLVLPPTRGDKTQMILDAIQRLEAGGSTAGGEGIQLAYQTAREHFQTNAANRVILCTDGDFNVGITQRGDLERMIEQEAKSGVFLTVLGFGMGNYKDSTLELLSNKGNGNYAYIDDFSEARKVLVDQFMGTLVTIAKDVKIQVEFNPAHVAGYRLIGYENRMLKKEDFNNDKVDAGEIGAGHTVTAFYEIIPVGQPFPDVPEVDALKYQAKPVDTVETPAGEILTLKLRYKEPDGDVSSKLEFPLHVEKLATMDPSRDFRFASAVAGFGMLLRESEFRGSITYEQVLNLAESSVGEDKLGYRAEFIKLVRNAMAIAGE